MALTIFDKIWNKHIIETSNRQQLLYVDLHLVHEVTSPQAFSKLREEGRTVRRPDLTFATADHNVPTSDRHLPIIDKLAKQQIEYLEKNCEEFGITFYGLDHEDNGIVHIIGPELGLTTPGKVIVCGDSHTSTHGAFGCFAFGIGSSEITHVLATQTLPQKKPKQMNIVIDGNLSTGVTSKDLILFIINKIGTNGGSGHIIEFSGSTIEKMSMEERMTLCNMAIEAGARSGIIAPDETTFNYIKGRRFAPKEEQWDEAKVAWSQLKTDIGATFDKTITIVAEEIEPIVTWGTNPSQSVPVHGSVPNIEDFETEIEHKEFERVLDYMGLKPGTNIEEITIDRVFIGSCTNSRLEDLQQAAQVVAGYKVHPKVRAIVVPGSYHVKAKAEEKGLDKIFKDAGFEWREPGCSMCAGINPDFLNSGERSASTSNRNFEGRQGTGARTHLVSPKMAAAAAIKGHFIDIRNWLYKGVTQNETV